MHSFVSRNWRLVYHLHRLQHYLLEKRVVMIRTVFPAQGYAGVTTVIIDNKFPDSPEALFTNEDMSLMANEFTNLQHLELLGCSLVTASGLTYLASRCLKLIYLHLLCCSRFDDDAVLAVVRASKSLQRLKISYCEVTLAGIHTLGTLTTVSAEGCPFSEVIGSFLSSV
ncbi:unnamed protein product [Arabis nemorensis]|uniref:Uncharacterized protein n=1 Tax=Arabis nemorensis TaxID=586526 RepID=A0A565B838_9BRAS|nr:unnamed protein product [Arabis nemorensis]